MARQAQVVVDSPVGPLLLVASEGALTHVWFDGLRRAQQGEVQVPTEDAEVLAAASIELAEYFAGERRDFDVPLRAATGELRRRIRDELTQVPWGRTITYGELARRVGMPVGSARAIGQAMHGNPLPVIVPCHRVIGANGLLTGYGGGLGRKVTLLRLEGVPTEGDQLVLFD